VFPTKLDPDVDRYRRQTVNGSNAIETVCTTVPCHALLDWLTRVYCCIVLSLFVVWKSCAKKVLASSVAQLAFRGGRGDCGGRPFGSLPAPTRNSCVLFGKGGIEVGGGLVTSIPRRERTWVGFGPIENSQRSGWLPKTSTSARHESNWIYTYCNGWIVRYLPK
jgi:hypothetical protein